MDTTNKITHAIIANQVALVRNEDLKHTDNYKHKLKQLLNPVIKELVKHEPEYDNFFNKVEDSTAVVFDVHDGFIKAIASVPIWDMQNITAMIEAYNKDPKSIQGIVNKILRT